MRQFKSNILYLIFISLTIIGCSDNKEELNAAKKKVIQKDFKFIPPRLEYTFDSNSFELMIDKKTQFNRLSFDLWLWDGINNKELYYGRSMAKFNKRLNKEENSVTFKGFNLGNTNPDSVWIRVYLTVEDIDLIDLTDKNRRMNEGQSEQIVYASRNGEKLQPFADWLQKKLVLIDYREFRKLEGEIKDSVQYEIDYLFGQPYEN
jgi:hypothetical protein